MEGGGVKTYCCSITGESLLGSVYRLMVVLHSVLQSPAVSILYRKAAVVYLTDILAPHPVFFSGQFFELSKFLFPYSLKAVHIKDSGGADKPQDSIHL